MRFKKTVVFDFDGVTHSYKSGWKGATVIADGPVSGIKEVIDELRKYYNVVIVSTRCFQPGGINAIKAWLLKYDIVVDDVLGEKPPAIVYVDDRAICFDGNVENLVLQIRNFENWIEKEKNKSVMQDSKSIIIQREEEQNYGFSKGCLCCGTVELSKNILDVTVRRSSNGVNMTLCESCRKLLANKLLKA